MHVHILTFTRGQAGSCGQSPVCTQEDLSVVRTAELRCSCQALGLEPPEVLDYEDRALEGVSQRTSTAYQQAVKAGLDDLAEPDSIARELGMKQLHTLPDEDATLKVEVECVCEQKMTAIVCHRIQAASRPSRVHRLNARSFSWEKSIFSRRLTAKQATYIKHEATITGARC